MVSHFMVEYRHLVIVVFVDNIRDTGKHNRDRKGFQGEPTVFSRFECSKDLEELLVDARIGVSLAVVSGKIDVGLQTRIIVEGGDGVPVHVQVLEEEENLTTLKICYSGFLALLQIAIQGVGGGRALGADVGEEHVQGGGV